MSAGDSASNVSRKVFVDTVILALAVGGESPHRAACRRILDGAANGEMELHLSAEALQELLFHRLRRGSRADAVAVVREVRAACVVHAFDEAVTDQMVDLVERSPIGGRDAVHAATALEAGFTEIVSLDRDFDQVPGLTRREPAYA
ncbi:type II toxin-antitoxin system VapC family toxin [Ruania alkalisoli]|uniref:Ribonuclease VapC n=1 Tax=Ruania alkalisoli TaxID=2779775 RepID=A0A7M1SVP7_9MICO|nr:type II toxin-antitoxin system VapC family toxin [Ruania alkalisoli]QOR70703.1 type II toxin-antitoxin system VapC family toxin [Ruania alkalisoli]